MTSRLMGAASVAAAASLVVVALPAAGQQAGLSRRAADRCVAGDLALPADGVWSRPEDGTWTVQPAGTLPPGQTGCVATRTTVDDVVSGVITFVAIPRTTPDGDRQAQVAAVASALARLTSMNVAVAKPKWRNANVPISGLDGFGHATMFGFDGRAITGEGRSDVIVLVFEGPAHLYAVSLAGAAEADDRAAWRGAVDGFRAMLTGLRKVGRKPSA